MNFCSHCGSDKLTFIQPENDTHHRFVCKECGKIHYVNPRMIVGCLAVQDDKILLCKRNIEPRKGLWNLPAGFLECGEKAEEGAARETFEEACALVEIERLHAVYSLAMVDQVYLHFFARLTNSNFGPTTESSEVRLFAPEEIPWDEIAFESTTFALQKYLEDKTNTTTHIGSLEKKGWG